MGLVMKMESNYGLGFIQNQNIKLFSGYIIFAGIAAVIELGLLYLLTDFGGLWYFYSAIISYLAGMLTNYTLNKYLNFMNRSRMIVLQFGLFATVAVVGLVLNQILLFVLVEFAGLWYMYAKLISMAIIVVWSFYGHKKLTFNLFK
jgi:putative flippase GtrA